MKGERRRARVLALQALFEIDAVSHPVGVVIKHCLEREESPSPRVERYCRELVTGVMRYRDALDVFIQEYATEWPLEQVAIVDRNLLRMALYEFTLGDVPPKVAINEAVELAKTFGSDSAPRFVNGVLGALVPQRDRIKSALRSETAALQR